MEQRKRYSPEKKVEILREFLENKKNLADIAEMYSIHPNIIHNWKKKFFEGAVNIFSNQSNKKANIKERKISQLESIIRDRDSLIAELVTDNVKLKKKLIGEI